MTSPFRCGTVALLGRPNVGKSTLINHIIGEKIAIVTPKPQTTRHRILGIDTNDSRQIVFIDTPGIHQGNKQLNRNMVRTAFAAAEEANVLAIMQDVSKTMDAGTRALIRQFADDERNRPRIHLLNKVDRVKKQHLLPRLQALQMLDSQAVAYIPLSASRGTQVDAFLRTITDHLPVQSAIYDPEWYTDQSQRQLATEYVREQVFLAMHQEIPFQTAVDIEHFEERKGVIDIAAVIFVGHERHKPMLIGKAGENLKHIGSEARKHLEDMFSCTVHLKLWVKVQPDWFNHQGHLHDLGLDG